MIPWSIEHCTTCQEFFLQGSTHTCQTSTPPVPAAPAVPSPSPWAQKQIRYPDVDTLLASNNNKKTPAGPAGNPDKKDIDDFIWNPETQTYDYSGYKVYRTKCECGLETLGYKTGHSDWCARKAIDG